jgi:hypothetical protein
MKYVDYTRRLATLMVLALMTVMLASCNTPAATAPFSKTHQKPAILEETNSGEIAFPTAPSRTGKVTVPIAVVVESTSASPTKVPVELDVKGQSPKALTLPVSVAVDNSKPLETKLPVSLNVVAHAPDAVAVPLGLSISATNVSPSLRVPLSVQVMDGPPTVAVPIRFTMDLASNMAISVPVTLSFPTNAFPPLILPVEFAGDHPAHHDEAKSVKDMLGRLALLVSLIALSGCAGGYLRVKTFERFEMDCEPLSVAMLWGVAAAISVPAFLEMTGRLNTEGLEKSAGYILQLLSLCMLAATFGAEFTVMAMKVFRKVYWGEEASRQPPSWDGQGINLEELAAELLSLEAAMSKIDQDHQHGHQIHEIKAAQKAAETREREQVVKRLQAAGSWALEIAAENKYAIAECALRKALGLPEVQQVSQ